MRAVGCIGHWRGGGGRWRGVLAGNERFAAYDTGRSQRLPRLVCEDRAGYGGSHVPWTYVRQRRQMFKSPAQQTNVHPTALALDTERLQSEDRTRYYTIPGKARFCW